MHHNCHVIWSSRVPHWHMPTGRRTYTYTYTIFRERVRRYGIRVREWKIEDGGREKGGANFFHAKAACVRTHTRTTFVYLATAKLMERNATDERTDGRMDGFLISRLSTMILSDSLRILTARNLRDRDSARHSSNSRLLVPPLPSFRFRCLTNPLLSSPLLSLPPPPGPDIQ